MENRTLNSLTIQQYFDGSLDPKKMHELEKQALEDEFLSDALEGFTYVIEPAQNLSILQRQLADRIQVQEATKKAFSITSQRLSIAAASGVMCVLAATLFWLNGYEQPATKRVEVSLSPQHINANAVKMSENADVNSYADIAEQISSSSVPVVGWKEYAQYIKNNIRHPKPISFKSQVKNIVVAFKISQSGGPVDLKVVNGLTDAYANEAIRIIKNGPKWKSVDAEEIKVKINFKK